MEAVIEIKIGKEKEILTVTFDQYNFSVDAKINRPNDFYGEFNGIVCSGYIYYNKKEIVIDYSKKEFYFFIDEIKTKVEKLMKRAKILKK